MKRNSSLTFMTIFALLGVMALLPGQTLALTLDSGSAIIAVDGNSDSNVSVEIFSVGGSPLYDYGYFLNGGSTFNTLTLLYAGIDNFQGGDIIDFALYDLANSKYYTLSGDNADDSYSVVMSFENPVTVGSPQQPVGWSNPYYYNANITWYLPTVLNTNELALNFTNDSNDGIAPVPEPTSLILLGFGLLMLGIIAKKRMKKEIA